MTRRGIFYNLEESCFNFSINGIILYFSSSFNLKRFKRRLKDYEEFTNNSLSNRFNLNVRLTNLCIISLYIKIEKRGFLIYNPESGVWYTCQEQILLSGENLTKKN